MPTSVPGDGRDRLEALLGLRQCGGDEDIFPLVDTFLQARVHRLRHPGYAVVGITGLDLEELYVVGIEVQGARECQGLIVKRIDVAPRFRPDLSRTRRHKVTQRVMRRIASDLARVERDWTLQRRRRSS
jgi:hypothetical protein